MRTALWFAVLATAIGGAVSHAETGVESIEISRYDIRVDVHPVKSYSETYGGWIDVACTLVVRNAGDEALRQLPLCLHRLLELKTAHTGAGEPVPFRQEIRPHPGFGPRYQANLATLDLPLPVGAGEESVVSLSYGGPVCGYTEALAYVWDHVSPDYTLLRTEAAWYPAVFRPYDKLVPFTYRLAVSVPAPLIAVSEGRLTGYSEQDGRATYTYESQREHLFLFSLAAAPFVRREVSEGVSIFHLPTSTDGVATAIRALERTEMLGVAWFGETPALALRVVEVPQRYGGQAARGLILQQSSAFTAESDDPKAYLRALRGLGHEAIHRWHPYPADTERSRWLTEGLTHYLEALVVREELGDKEFRACMEDYRQRLLRAGKIAMDTPVTEAGGTSVEEPVSRGKGPWVYHVLHELVGEEVFLEVIGTYFHRYRGQRVTIPDFTQVAASVAGRDLEDLFSDWLYTTRSSGYLAEGTSVGELANLYR
ncbi:M1 family metallopeptidase [Candidatus Latescibacterota bacterium]